MSDAPNTRRLARQLVDVTRRLKHLETVPQLAHSSLDDQGMHVYDADGNVSVTLGKQSDGTYSARPVRGPIPPAPAGLGAEGDAGLVHASWQGVFWAGAAMPRDFEAVEVLVDGNVHGAIHDPDGGSVTVPAFAGEREVSFRTLSQAGRRSDATGHVTVTVQSKASVQLDEARGRIDEAKAESAEALGRADEARTEVDAARDRLDVVENVTIPGVVADLTEAIDNIEVDGNGVTTYQTPYEPDETTDPAPKTGDLWFDTDNDMALHRHDGTVWVSVADGRIPSLIDAQGDLEADIATVRTSVDGKTKITQSLDAPPTQYEGAVGDRWERMSSMGSGGRLVSNWRWNGAVWVSTLIDDAVLGNLDASKLVAGSATINNAVIDKLWTDGVMAKTVASNSITVSPGNLLPDPNGNTDIGRNAYANLGFVWSDTDKAWVKSTPTPTNQTKPNAGGDYTSYPLEGGRTYRLYFEAKVEDGTGGGRYAIYYTRHDGTTAFVGDGVEGEGGDTAVYTPIPADTWTAVDRTWVAPADAVMGGFALQVNNVNPAQAQRVLIRNPFAGVK